MTAAAQGDQRDCSEGCDDDGHKHRWEIEPAPGGDFDVWVTDDDDQAIQKLIEVAEWAWDSIGEDQEIVIKIRRNKQ